MLQHVTIGPPTKPVFAHSTNAASVAGAISSKDSTNGVNPAGQLPTQIREALENVLKTASKNPMHWT